MSILDRSALEESSLADLHAIASELSIDGYRRLRRPELIDAILARQGGESEGAADVLDAVEEDLEADEEPQPSARRRRGRRGGRGRSATAEDEAAEPGAAEDEAAEPGEAEGEAAEPGAGGEAAEPELTGVSAPEAEEIVEGVVELLPGGSGFMRVNPPDPSEDDVYISAAQIKRCELISGDTISGPRRAARRSERFASLVRIDTINGRPAAEVGEAVRFEDLPAAFPWARFQLGSDDPTIKAIEWLTPFGRGSRMTIAGRAQSGKTEALRRLAVALARQDDIQLLPVLAGVRPEEVADWTGIEPPPAAVVTLGASADAQAGAVDRVLDQARRLAVRGAHAVVLIDSLDGLSPHAARRALAAARNLVDRGSVTVIATAREPLGGETTVIALDGMLTSVGRYPALDLVASWTMRPELLVGEAGAEAIRNARAQAIEG